MPNFTLAHNWSKWLFYNKRIKKYKHTFLFNSEFWHIKLFQLAMEKLFYKVFVQEDDKEVQKIILEDYKDNNYKISFFSKSDSVFDLLNFNPDILVQDYLKNKIVNCLEWSTPYNY